MFSKFFIDILIINNHDNWDILAIIADVRTLIITLLLITLDIIPVLMSYFKVSFTAYM